jgi:8-oxo-dGTP pyrophosphatase MutT (NUDIX family)
MLRRYRPAAARLGVVQWTVHGERVLYDSEWVRLTLVDVEVPGGERFEHHVVRMPNFAAGAVVHDRARGLLLIHRHRFITDTWGWEIPAGRIDPGETPEVAAARETLEETGWRPGPLTPLVDYQPTNGLSDQRFHVFLAEGATHEGDPTDPGEAARVEWVPLDDVRALVRRGEMVDGLSLTAVLWALQFAPD